MHVKQCLVRSTDALAGPLAELAGNQPDLLLVFGAVKHFADGGLAASLQAAFPDAALLGCSTAGEITADGVDDGTCTLTAVRFEQTTLTRGSTRLAGMDDSFAAGERLGRQIAAVNLKSVLIFGPGVQINGSALVNGMSSIIGTDIPITGGLAGDGGTVGVFCGQPGGPV